MRRRHKLDDFIGEIGARQRNIVFPDTVRNARAVDAFFWRGSPHPTIVQRITAWTFGLLSIVLGIEFFSQVFLSASSFIDVLLMVSMSFLSVFAGIRIFRNGFPRPATPLPKSHHQNST
jgi:hypothetical protein